MSLRIVYVSRVLALAFSLCAFAWTSAKAAPAAREVSVTAGKLASVSAKLEDGGPVDLAFAAKSSMACWPATKNEHFSGSHAFFIASLPAKSVMKIRAVPGKSDLDLSLYAYQIGAGKKTLPPAISSATACEASYGTKSMSKPYNPGATESVELNATTNAYSVIIGVAGAGGAAAGAFTLEIDLETAAAAPTGSLTEAAPIAVARGESKSVAGSIDGGKRIDLAWAANSSVACFPATSFDHFDGKHVLYQLELPKNTTATIELVPKQATADLSLYAYSVGTTNTSKPPNVPSCVSCEASYGTKSMSQRYNPGGAERVELVAINNPYRVFIGVAGAQQLDKGAFDLKVTLTPR